MDTRQSNRPTVAILYTPAARAGGLEPGVELDRVAAEHRRSDRRIGEETLADLKAQGWLRQVRWRRGGYLTTKGLRSATGTPELAMLNVPSVFAPWACKVLDRIADFILRSGARMQPGEIFALRDQALPAMVVTFDLIEPGDIKQPAFADTMLVVVPLP